MKSQKRGKRISSAEVTNVSRFGVWVLVRDHEYFMDYDEYPWFRDATIGQISNVKLIHGDHLHWPELDVDLHLESLLDAAAYPLIDRVGKRS